MQLLTFFLLLILLLILGTLGGCSNVSLVSPLGEHSYLIEAYYNPKSATDRKAAIYKLDQRSVKVCGSDYYIEKQFEEPDLYWGDVVIYREIECVPLGQLATLIDKKLKQPKSVSVSF